MTRAIENQFHNTVRNGPHFVARIGVRYVALELDAEPQPIFYLDTNYAFIGGTP